jgi:chromosome segregation ATPase
MSKTNDPISTAVVRLDELSAETRQIEDRISGIARLTEKVKHDLALKEEALRQSQAGGLIDPPEELVESLNALKDKLRELDSERKALQKRREASKGEAVKELRAALRPAWQKYVKARESEIDAALKAVPRVRKALEPFFEASRARREADGAFQHLLGKVERVAGLRAKGRITSELQNEKPAPLKPTDIPDVSFEDRRAWLTSLELRRAFSSRVWTDPDYNKN